MLVAHFILLGALVHLEATAHLNMVSPRPFRRESPDNSPLAADGSDFPCKLRPNGFETPLKSASIRIGEPHTVKLQGTATHGGGSCQISLTTDQTPSKDSEWVVIKSFEGGCPANVDGNLQGGSMANDLFSLDFVIPDSVDPGNYTLAWTWFNRIGNREMYMECAPIIVTNDLAKWGASGRKALSMLPPMFVANINGCLTKENVDVRFPQPGAYVESKGKPDRLASPSDPACTGTPAFGSAAGKKAQYDSRSAGQSTLSPFSAHPTYSRALPCL